MRVEVLHEVPDDVIEDFYGLYRAAFEPLRTLAAARRTRSRRARSSADAPPPSGYLTAPA